ncbi:sugar phosphate nucleotidyltransferase [Patescibacteria group bacterium]
MSKSVSAIVLAAGKGTRMNSENKNKVILELLDKPMICYTIENLKKSGINDIITVVSYAKESVKKALGNEVTYVDQKVPLGTGHAVKAGLKKISNQSSHIISMYGDDSAFYPPKLIEMLIDHHDKSKAAITLLTIKKDDPTGLGRIIRNSDKVTAIVEEKVATKDQKKIKEINTGLYCFNKKFLEENISSISKNKISGEYYLTDIVEIAKNQNEKVEALYWEDDSVWFGVNTPQQLRKAQKLMRQKTQ